MLDAYMNGFQYVLQRGRYISFTSMHILKQKEGVFNLKIISLIMHLLKGAIFSAN